MDIRLSLPFPAAGVAFDIDVAGGAFTLSVRNAESGEGVAFVSDASPVIADWVRGYARWLYRCGVSAEIDYDNSRIVGAFADGMSAERMLEGVRLACDMIRQRFELYESGVLVG